MWYILGFEMVYDCPQATPMILALSIHYSRASDLLRPEALITAPPTAVTGYRDMFGNWCSRLIAPAGRLLLRSEGLISDSGHPDEVAPGAGQVAVEHLPDDTLVYLLGSRYCETDLLSKFAWDRFGDTPTGWARVQAICDFVHQHIKFNYAEARSTRTAYEVYVEGRGVCRDYAHLAITLCRCMNIPARYCTGYLSDTGTPMPHAPTDFAAWFEAFLGKQWYTFDARNNTPRVGRILMARGRDACDVALSNSFGPAPLSGFQVWIDEVPT